MEKIPNSESCSMVPHFWERSWPIRLDSGEEGREEDEHGVGRASEVDLQLDCYC